jgi:hypothetical protein
VFSSQQGKNPRLPGLFRHNRLGALFMTIYANPIEDWQIGVFGYLGVAAGQTQEAQPK